jgi:hypothetical protein
MKITVFEGSVQRKKAWINNNVNRWVLAGTRAGHNFRCPLISLLSVDPLINGTALIFHFKNVN